MGIDISKIFTADLRDVFEAKTGRDLRGCTKAIAGLRYHIEGVHYSGSCQEIDVKQNLARKVPKNTIAVSNYRFQFRNGYCEADGVAIIQEDS